MCGRFSLTKQEAEMESRFNARFYSNDLMKRYNVAPSQLSLVITDNEPGELQLFKWGLVPSWAKDPKIGYSMINAKTESIFEKPSFLYLIKKRRCLVISDGFYEWKISTNKTKVPYRFCLPGEELFTFAGLWDTWTNRESREILNTFTIITTNANPLVSQVHDRMPVILNPEDELRYLGGTIDDQEIMELLNPYPESQMKAYGCQRF